MNINCVVACKDSNGSPDLYALRIQCSEEQYENGDHYERAKEAVEENGYEASDIVFDENDYAFKVMFQVDFIDWETTSIYTI